MAEIVWPVELLEVLAFKQEWERQSLGKFRATKWNLAAEREALEACERKLNCKLDAQHRSFLECANGWEDFTPGIALFSTADLMGSPRFQQACNWVQEMDRRVLGPYVKRRGDLVPIGKSDASTDLLVMLRDAGQVGPRVVWFANELIEDYASFLEFFASFKSYLENKVRTAPIV